MEVSEIAQASKNIKILYVEDDEKTREPTLRVLKNFFNNIVTSNDGEEGLAKFNSDTFDIVISDINMPKLSGIEMAEGIRKSNSSIPILFLSAYNEAEYILDGIKVGADGYILKPIELKQFIDTVGKIVEKVNLKKKSESYTEYLEEEVKRRTSELENLLYFDKLTGVYSRYSFFEDIKKYSIPILLIVDIDKFKIINEIYGTEKGSRVLQGFAKFLMEFTKQSTYKVYRLSGDEFALVDDVSEIDEHKYEVDLDKFFKLLNDFRIDLGDDSISVEATIGVSTLRADAFESAKVALDFAKTQKKQYMIYSPEIDKRDEEESALLCKNKIKKAISDNRITAVYQPIVNISGETVKYETLMRIRSDKTGKLISPYYFLDVSIKTGLYGKLSEYVVLEALNKLSTSSNSVSINFTYGDIKNSSFLNKIESFFTGSSGLGKRVVFEITESESIGNYDDVKEFIKRFKAYGVRFAIDDFGSGFSNFEYILEIEPDYLKIDGSLVKNIDKDEKSHILVKAIVQFSHELGIKVIAEFVHSEVIFKMLKDLHVDEYQGYYFSEPLEDI